MILMYDEKEDDRKVYNPGEKLYHMDDNHFHSSGEKHVEDKGGCYSQKLTYTVYIHVCIHTHTYTYLHTYIHLLKAHIYVKYTYN